jgi:hypothetical protein
MFSILITFGAIGGVIWAIVNGRWWFLFFVILLWLAIGVVAEILVGDKPEDLLELGAKRENVYATAIGKFTLKGKYCNFIKFKLENGEEIKILVTDKEVFEHIYEGDYGKLTKKRIYGDGWVLKDFLVEVSPKSAEKAIICDGCGASFVIKEGYLGHCEYCSRAISVTPEWYRNTK